MRATRSRVIIFVGLAVGCLVGSVIVLKTSGASRSGDQIVQSRQSAEKVRFDARALSSAGIIVFRDMGGPNRGPGQLAWASLSDPQGPRHFIALSCARAYFNAGHGLCLGFFKANPIFSYEALIFDRNLRIQHTLGLPGPPSRRRVSSEGRHAATTAFEVGHNYSTVGSFSTETRIIDLATGDRLPNLEQWHDTDNGHPVTARNRNYWGVTFAHDDDHFYATRGEGVDTWLVEGSIRERSLHTIHENVGCPSLSPDGTRIAYKKQVSAPQYPGAPVEWRFTVLNLRTGRETPPAERESIDDQIEWLDNQHVLYGKKYAVWIARADGSGRPHVFIPNADSPSVVRPASASPT